MNISLTGGVELHPRKALGESAGVLGKELRKLRVLEVADPVRHAEVAEVDDWDDVERLEATERLVREVPVIAVVSQPSAMDGWAIAQVTDIEILQESEVRLPMLVMAAGFQFVDPDTAALDRRIAVLDASGEHVPMCCCHLRTPG
jgi:hypothetical protein